MNVVLLHTTSAIIVGVLQQARSQRHGLMGVVIENPVVVLVGAENVNLMPMFTLTVEREYFVPIANLLYAEPMTPTPGLVKAYLDKYAPSAGIGELTTYPSPAPAPGEADFDVAKADDE